MVFFFLNPTGPFCAHGRCSVCATAENRKNRLVMFPTLRMGVQGPLYQDSSNKTRLELLPVLRMGVQRPLYQESSNKTDWNCCQFSEWVCKVHSIKTVQIKQTGIVASSQNGCAKSTLSRQFKQNVTVARKNHSRDKFHSLLCSKFNFVVLKHFKCFTVYNYTKNEKS